MTTTPSPNDDPAHLDGLLMANLTGLNTLLGRYVVRFLDADAGRAKPVSIEDERRLAHRLSVAADGVQARVARREQQGDPPPLVHYTRDTEKSY